jgi:hypothetical protein
LKHFFKKPRLNPAVIQYVRGDRFPWDALCNETWIMLGIDTKTWDRFKKKRCKGRKPTDVLLDIIKALASDAPVEVSWTEVPGAQG